MNFNRFICSISIVMASLTVFGKDVITISTAPFGDSMRHWYGIMDKSNIIQPRQNQPRFKESQITEIADNILLYQRNNGGWPKNYDMQAILTDEQKDSLILTKNILHTTIDNGTTYTQIYYLAQVFQATHIQKYAEGTTQGVQFLLDAQYPNGGWPQFFPLEKKNYSSHITFNDGAYMGVMELFKLIDDNDSVFSFLSSKMKEQVHEAYKKGINCILRTQIKDNGRLTAWCQQHDEVTLQPAWARAFEPPCICNGESAEIVLFLMRLKNPSSEIKNAIELAIAWFRISEIKGIRVQTESATPFASKYRKEIDVDKVVVKDSLAPTIWTRYYELKSHRPLFCDRNGKFLYQLSDVSRERRVGYGWYTYSPQAVLNKYLSWHKKNK